MPEEVSIIELPDDCQFKCPRCKSNVTDFCQEVEHWTKCICCPNLYVFYADCRCPLDKAFHYSAHYWGPFEWNFELKDWMNHLDD